MPYIAQKSADLTAPGPIGGTTPAAGTFTTLVGTDLAIRNGVTATKGEIYNTYTDGSNYERAFMRWDSNYLNIGCEAAGTGAIRSVILLSPAILYLQANGKQWQINMDGHFLASYDNQFDIGAVGATRPRHMYLGGYQELSENTAPAAPAANNVRIYAVDNGAGKTQLMALFASGVAQQIAIEP